MAVDDNKPLAVRFFEALDTGNTRSSKTSSRKIVFFIAAI
jgi:hypothetical protein